MSNVTTLLDAKSVPAAKAALICPTRNETYSYGRLRDEMNRLLTETIIRARSFRARDGRETNPEMERNGREACTGTRSGITPLPKSRAMVSSGRVVRSVTSCSVPL